MLGIVCVIEDQWNYTLTDRDMDVIQMYSESAGILGADFLAIIDRTTPGIYHNGDNDRIPFSVFKTYDELFEEYPHYTRVFFSQKYKADGYHLVDLNDMAHPHDALYIFGGDGGGLCLKSMEIRSRDIIATIPLPGDLWQIACVSIVLYDRLRKSKQWQ